MDETRQLAGLARVLRQLLRASFGLYPDDVAREVRDALGHLGGEDAVLLLADYDQRVLVGFDLGDDGEHAVDGLGPGLAFRHERPVDEALDDGRRRLWVPIKDSAERIGVLGLVDDGTVAVEHWEAVGSLLGELLVSKAEYGDHIKLRRRRRPFTLAAEMRWGMLPPLTFTAPHVVVSGVLEPSYGIAGDAFDYDVTAGRASVGIFDAMGHGMEASRMANVAVASYRNSRRRGAGPVECLADLDEVVAAEYGDARFVTAQVASLDLADGSLEIANAGHPPPFLLRAGGAPEVIPCPPARPAGVASTPSTITLRIGEGDHVLFHTDGVDEARDGSGGQFGGERMAALVAGLVEEDVPPAEVLRLAMRRVADHQGGEWADDATLVLLTWRRALEIA